MGLLFGGHGGPKESRLQLSPSMHTQIATRAVGLQRVCLGGRPAGVPRVPHIGLPREVVFQRGQRHQGGEVRVGQREQPGQAAAPGVPEAGQELVARTDAACHQVLIKAGGPH